MWLVRSLRAALGSVWKQRRRTWPAALGVAVGVGSMVTMVAVGQGAEHSVVEKIQAMGANLVVVAPGQTKVIAGRPRQVGDLTTLRLADAEHLQESTGALAVAPAYGGKLAVKHEGLASTTTVVGTTAPYLAIRAFELARGRVFDEVEARAAMRVAILGPTVVRNVFGGDDPVGATLRIANVPFEVIGVLAPKGLDSSGNDQDDQILVPIRTALRRLFNADHLNNVYLTAAPGQAAALVDEVTAALRDAHRLRAGRGDDFSVQNQADVLAAEQSAAESFTILLGAVAAVALLIGGVGVLAVMLIAVRERVREIGLRRAVGATRADILVQFATEALLIGAAGAVMGVGLGAAAALSASALGGWPVVLSAKAGALATAVSVVVALAFGAVPARRAAAIDPATSLRSA